MHEAKLAKMEAEMKMGFQQKVQEKESKLKQSEEELYARHKEMKDALEKQRLDLEEKKKRIETGRPLTPEKNSVCSSTFLLDVCQSNSFSSDTQEGCVWQPLGYPSLPLSRALSIIAGFAPLTLFFPYPSYIVLWSL